MVYITSYKNKELVDYNEIKPNFSIVVIAKNEEKSIPRLLKSLRFFIEERKGEVLILDTGSMDNTVSVAKAHGCVVHEVGDKFIRKVDKKLADKINKKFLVENEPIILKAGDKFFDFSAARNCAASLASNDMVSMPDADEEFTSFNIERLEELIRNGIEQIEFNFVFAHDEFGGESIKFIQCKFYDRRKLHWEGIIHEVLQGKAKRVTVPEEVLKIEHWQNPTQNRAGYLKGLALDCYLNPGKDRNSHYFARELLWNGRPYSAIKEFKRHISMNGWLTERAQSMIFIGDACGQIGQPAEQVEWYNKSFYLDSSRREALVKLARFYQHNNNPQATACYAAAAMEIPWTGFYANNMAHYQNEPHEIMYWAKGWMGQIGEAQTHLLKALDYQPFNANYLRDTKYYFEYPDQGIEGWMTFKELSWLYDMAKQVDTIVEVGSWKGRSTHALCSGNNGKVIAIDHFKGSKGEESQHREAETNRVYKEYLKNVGHFSHLKTMKMTSEKAAKKLKGKKFDMIFIDGEHTYEGVKKDIKLWKNKARKILCGHDYSPKWPAVVQAVKESLGEVEVHDTIWIKRL